MFTTRSRTDIAGRAVIWQDDSTYRPTVHAFAPFQLYDDFVGPALNNVYTWNVTVEAGAIAWAAGDGGLAVSTPAAADNDTSELSSSLILYGTCAPCIEVKLSVTDVDKSAIFVGMTDAVTEGAGLLPVSYNGGAITPTADDCIGFLWDADSVAGMVRMVARKANATTMDTATTIPLLDGVPKVFRVEMDASCNARFYINGAYVGGGSALVTPGDPLCVEVGHSQRSNDAADTVIIRSIRAWQNL